METDEKILWVLRELLAAEERKAVVLEAFLLAATITLSSCSGLLFGWWLTGYLSRKWPRRVTPSESKVRE